MLKKFRTKIASAPAERRKPATPPEDVDTFTSSSTSKELEVVDRRRSSAPLLDRRRSSGTSQSVWPEGGRRRQSSGTSVRSPRTLSTDARAVQRGLRLVHQPPSRAPIDIIFVHGLGGHIWKTWSSRDHEHLFWPGNWLPEDVDVGKARIFSFGYNADFGPGSGKSIASVVDFAKDLLHDMQYGNDEQGQDLQLGKVPIIFVAHSMGGLIVKKAYLFGRSDSHFRDMVESVGGVVFLGTPHRGSGFAEILNKVLMASFQQPKGFIADLTKGSAALEELNEDFRHVAENLSIWSFYETLGTKIAGSRLLIVDKDSAVLGYPREISRSLDADHVNMCKFSSQDDANYLSVKNALRSLIAKFKARGRRALSEQTSEESQQVSCLLASPPSCEDDFIFFRDLRAPGTCAWILNEATMQCWIDEAKGSQVLWYTAPPGVGKSVLSAFLVDHLRDSGLEPQVFFFRFGDQKRRTATTCLQSIAFQLAAIMPDFRSALHELADEGLKVDKFGHKLLWEKLFRWAFSDLQLDQPLYWIIDGLDEAEIPEALVDLFQTLPGSAVSVRLLIVSRKTASLSLAFDKLAKLVPVTCFDNSDRQSNASDIQTVITRELEHMRGSDDFKSSIANALVERAEGSLLWLRLVLQEILSCHTEEDVIETLRDVPDDMNSFYRRMETAITKNQRKANVKLAKSLLRWVVCSRRSLRLEELAGALPGFLDLRRTIHDVCGQFVIIDHAGNVSLIHQTARDYLTFTSTSEIAVNMKDGNGDLCTKSLEALLDDSLWSRLTQTASRIRATEHFVVYAARSWTYHLRHSSLSPETLALAAKFLQSSATLTWIYTLALLDELHVLVRAAKDFIVVSSKIRKANATKNPLLQRLSEIDLLERWSVDLVKLVAKFSNALLKDPQAIYRTIPGLCPTQSILYEQFSRSDSVRVSVSGVPSSSWSDNLVRMILPYGESGIRVTAAGQFLAVLSSSGTTHVWYAHTFAVACTVHHQEPVIQLCMNKKGDRLATYGLSSTKHWSIPSGEVLGSAPNDRDTRALTLVFADNDRRLLGGMDDKVIRSLDLSPDGPGWQVLADSPARESANIEHSFINAPVWMAFNTDRTQVGLAYRGFPLTIYSVTNNCRIGRSKRSKAFRAELVRPTASWFSVERFTFNPTGHVLGVYKDGCIFKWHPLTDENQEVQSTADEIDSSADGKLFITSDYEGRIAIWSFAFMSKIYQLSSSDIISGLVFAPDSQRFYDIRDRALNAWEPNALIRFAERESSAKDSLNEDIESSVTHTSEAHLAHVEPATALSLRPTGTLSSMGNEEGIVYLVETRTAQRRKIAEFSNFQCVTHLSWSDDGICLAAADLSGDILLATGLPTASSTARADATQSQISNIKVDLHGQGIRQIVLNFNGTLVLVISNFTGYIWSVADGILRVSLPLEDCKLRRWLSHPSDPGLFMAIGALDVKMYGWADFKEVATLQIFASTPSGTPDVWITAHDILPGASTEWSVVKVIRTQDGTHVLVQLRTVSPSGDAGRKLVVFDCQDFDCRNASLPCYPMPQDISALVEVPLGILPGSQVVFLNSSLWICTFHLGSPPHSSSIKRHYFIPRDWASIESFEMSCMLRDGTLLCPKDDSVAIVSYTWGIERI